MSIESRSEPFDRYPRSFIPPVGPKADAMHHPGLKGMRQHQQLGFGVYPSSLSIRREPSPADLDHVWQVLTTLVGVPDRPVPRLDITKPGRADYPSGRAVDSREREHIPRVPAGQRLVHVSPHVSLVRRNIRQVIRRS